MSAIMRQFWMWAAVTCLDKCLDHCEDTQRVRAIRNASAELYAFYGETPPTRKPRRSPRERAV